MLFQSERTESEVNELAQRLEDGEDEGTKYPGMSYEQGALSMLEYLEGRVEADEIYER